jgi:hypothetical protein
LNSRHHTNSTRPSQRPGKKPLILLSQRFSTLGIVLLKKTLYFYGDPGRLDIKALGEKLSKWRLTGFSQNIGRVEPLAMGAKMDEQPWPCLKKEDETDDRVPLLKR